MVQNLKCKCGREDFRVHIKDYAAILTCEGCGSKIELYVDTMECMQWHPLKPGE